MPKLSRRDFLISVGTLPFVKLAIPQLSIPAVLNSARQQTQTGAADQPNFLMILFDTWSARHMSVNGYDRETTPHLARLAERATVYHNHIAGGNYTSPGTASLLTGTYPWTHHCLQTYGHIVDSVAHHNIFNLLPDSYHKVAYTHNPLASAQLHQFRANIDELKPRSELTMMDGLWSDVRFPNDYPVAINAERLIGGRNLPPSATYLDLFKSLRAGLSRKQYEREFAEQFPRGMPEDGANYLYGLFTLERAINWVGDISTSSQTPYFHYVHLWPPHAPYATRGDFVDVFKDGKTTVEKEHSPIESDNVPQSQLDEARRLYNEYIRYVDAEFARLFDMMEKSGALDNTYVILTSDHGEMFERGIRGHTTALLPSDLINIPLMIWKPGQTERVDVHERTSAVDLLPTLLQLTGQPMPELAEGTILPSFPGATQSADRDIFTVEAKRNNAFVPLHTATIAIHRGPYKLVQYTGYDTIPEGDSYFEMYNLENDPEEMENLYDIEKSIARELAEEVRRRLEQANEPFRRV